MPARPESVIRQPPPAPPATIYALRQFGTSVASIPMTPVESVATVVVMEVSAATRRDVAGRLRHGRRFPSEKAPTCELLRSLTTVWPGLDAHRMVRIHDALDLHTAARQAHFCLNALALPPGRKIEHRDFAPSLNRAECLFHGLHSAPFGALHQRGREGEFYADAN